MKSKYPPKKKPEPKKEDAKKIINKKEMTFQERLEYLHQGQ